MGKKKFYENIEKKYRWIFILFKGLEGFVKNNGKDINIEGWLLDFY